MLAVVVVYLGLIAAFLGCVSLLRPLTVFAIRSRRQATLHTFASGQRLSGPGQNRAAHDINLTASGRDTDKTRLQGR